MQQEKTLTGLGLKVTDSDMQQEKTLTGLGLKVTDSDMQQEKTLTQQTVQGKSKVQLQGKSNVDQEAFFKFKRLLSMAVGEESLWLGYIHFDHEKNCPGTKKWYLLIPDPRAIENVRQAFVKLQQYSLDKENFVRNIIDDSCLLTLPLHQIGPAVLTIWKQASLILPLISKPWQIALVQQTLIALIAPPVTWCTNAVDKQGFPVVQYEARMQPVRMSFPMPRNVSRANVSVNAAECMNRMGIPSLKLQWQGTVTCCLI